MLRILFVIMFLLTPSITQADPSIVICRDGDSFHVSGLNDIGWDAITGGGSFENGILIADPLQDGTIQILFWWTENDQDHMDELWGSSKTPLCNNENWQPDAPSIFLPLISDCSFAEIRDEWGNYHLVESQGEPVLLHYGQALIGGYFQSDDPADYRIIPTECY